MNDCWKASHVDGVCMATIHDSQVGMIINDLDVKSFYKSLLSNLDSTDELIQQAIAMLEVAIRTYRRSRDPTHGSEYLQHEGFRWVLIDSESESLHCCFSTSIASWCSYKIIVKLTACHH